MCYRVKMNFGARGEDFAERAWQNNMIGIWYGSWTPEELYAAYGAARPVSARDTAERLNKLMTSRGDRCVISEAGVKTALRFDDKWSAWLDLYQCRRDTLDKESVWDEGRSTSLSRW